MAVPNYYGLTEFGRAIANSMDMNKLGRVASGVAVKIVDPETGEILGPNKVMLLTFICIPYDAGP